MKGIKRFATAYGIVNMSRLPDAKLQMPNVDGPHLAPRPNGDDLDTYLQSPSFLSEPPDALSPNQQPLFSNGNAFSEQPFQLNSFASPYPATSFQATTYTFSGYIPPDTDGAAGPNHLVTALNGIVQIQDRAGNLLQSKSLDNFWGASNIGGSYSYDPTVLYDPYNNRWILTSCANPDSTHGRILLAVSQTGDPTGNWYLWTTYPNASKPSVIFSNGYPADWADYDRTGFNKNWIVI